MNIFQSALLGIIQGLTEFLPISSSGHLVLVQSLIPNFSQEGILFDTFLHFGTILAILVFYFDKIRKLAFEQIRILIIATIPAVIVGFLLKDQIDTIFQNTFLVGVALIVTGLMNLRTDKHKEMTDTVGTKNGIIIGLFQAFAILPGISRSGSTIFGGTLMGIKKEKAAEFSFLLSIPAVLGANLLEIIKSGEDFVLLPEYIVGIICSFVFGLICIKVLLNMLSTNKFKYFGYYCILIGVVSLIAK